MNEFKKTTMLMKGGKAPVYIGIIIAIATQLSGWICSNFPTIVSAAGRVDLPGVFSIFGVDRIDDKTLPTVIAVVLSTIVAMAINWWKRVLWVKIKNELNEMKNSIMKSSEEI